MLAALGVTVVDVRRGVPKCCEPEVETTPCEDDNCLREALLSECCTEPCCEDDDGVRKDECVIREHRNGRSSDMLGQPRFCCAHKHLARHLGTDDIFAYQWTDASKSSASLSNDGARAESIKSKFIVEAMCCSNEEKIVSAILEAMPGVLDVSLCSATRVVLVSHDTAKASAVGILGALNEANMDATLVGTDGESKGFFAALPPWNVLLCCALVLVSLGGYVYAPLRWVGAAAAIVGSPQLAIKAWAGLRRGIVGIHFLMLLATAGSIAINESIDAGILLGIFSIAEWLETKTLATARKSLEAVMSLRPDEAEVIGHGSGAQADRFAVASLRPVEAVRVGDIVAVRPGGKIPVDGVVLKGESVVNESSLTGESKGVAKSGGAQVYAGTINQDSYLEVLTTTRSEDSTVSKLANLVEEAAMQRSSSERMVEGLAKYYTPLILFAALLIATIPTCAIPGTWDDKKKWLNMACTLLVAGCPCALVLSTPATVISGIAAAANNGALIKGGQYLEALGSVKKIAFDKTGTLTQGKYKVNGVVCTKGYKENELFYWLGSVESQSSHPIASAITAEAKSRGISLSENVDGYRTLPGMGVSAVVDGTPVFVGNKGLYITRARADEGTAHEQKDELEKIAGMWEREGHTVCFVCVGPNLVGVFAVADTVRKGAKSIVDLLGRKYGIEISMLTGDNRGSAESIAQKLGLNASERVWASLTPQDKLTKISELRSALCQNKGSKCWPFKKARGMVAMVGDGVNDAPALAAADLGVAMGAAGSPVAMETADVVLFSESLTKLTDTIALARRVRRLMWTNIITAVLLKGAVIATTLAGITGLVVAVFSDLIMCLLVIGIGTSVLWWPTASTKV